MRLDELQGQEQLRRVLAGDLSAGTVSHAVLITGPSGSGKRTWGKTLARALLCEEPRGLESCMQCGSCRRIDSGSHPGFFYLEPKSRKIKIEQIREIRSKFYLDGENRVCLVSQADQMTAETASSLLKILEDPPRGLYFILLAAQEQHLFSTIVSRCRRFSLCRLSAEQISAVLAGRGSISPAKAAAAVRLSGGLPGAALALAEDPLFETRLREAADLAGRLASSRLSPRDIIEEASALAEREDLLSLLELVYMYYRDGMIRQLCRSEMLLGPGLEDGVCRFDTVPPAVLESVLEMIHHTLKDLTLTNVNRRLTLEGALIRLQRRFLYAQGYRGALSAGR